MRNVVVFLGLILLCTCKAQNITYQNDLGLYFRNGMICDGTERSYDSIYKRTMVHVFQKGNHLTTMMYDSLMNLEQLLITADKMYIDSKWRNNQLISHKVSKLINAYWDEQKYEWEFDNVKKKNYLDNYSELIDSVKKVTGYDQNGNVTVKFNCNFRKNCDCVRNTYDSDGKLISEEIFRPYKFLKIDTTEKPILPYLLSMYEQQFYYPQGTHKFFYQGKLDEKIIFKNGRVEKTIKYVYQRGQFRRKVITQN